jgi:large subunit ribosomal protein L15
MAQLQLSNLTSAGKDRKRIGRGGSRGGTSGRGHKGQKARTGGVSKVRTSFEGGQMPLVRRLPKRGFSNIPFKSVVEIVNIDALERTFEVGQQITRESLIDKGLIRGIKNGQVKILGNGNLTKKLIIQADLASEAAVKAVEQAGGKIELTKEM